MNTDNSENEHQPLPGLVFEIMATSQSLLMKKPFCHGLAPYFSSTLSCRSRLHFIIHFIIKLIAFGKIFH